MAKLKLSIIIPTKNEERDLPVLLASIQDQKFTDYEIIVADAGSTDKTREIAKKFGCRVVGGGMPAIGRNMGAKEAQGEFLLFLDGDVILSRNFLSQVIYEMEAKEIDAASCGVVPLSEKMIDFILHEVVNAYISVTQYFYPHAPGFCIIIKKSLHDKIGGFNETLRLAEDHDYVKRAKDKGKFKILKKAKIFVSVRRLEEDGRFNVSTKYVLCELHRMMVGEINTDIFKYKLGQHYDKVKEKVKK
ncbi:MAG: glycosyltransferase [bacterium]